MKIYGAGLAGLLAACAWQRAEVWEANPRPRYTGHRALLRFRSPAVGDAVGIQFRKVHVHKEIWGEFGPARPTIALANAYSMKVIGRLADRSIWSLDPVDRWVAPADFIEQLIDRVGDRIHWGKAVTARDLKRPGPAISTLPMPTLVGMLRLGAIEKFTASSRDITVERWRVPGADVYQTIYFPSQETTLYRASITGDLLTAEYVGQPDDAWFLEAFGLVRSDVEFIDVAPQKNGKLAEIDDQWRKQFIFWLTQTYGIYSLGRFGTWRNILLDDVLKDIDVIKKLDAGSAYDHAKALAG